MKYIHFLFFAALLTIAACGDDDDPQLDADIILIEEYLADNNLTAERTSSGLHYIITSEGIGTNNPTSSSSVVIRYKGYRLDGSVFDQTQGSSSGPWPLSELIKGWQEGIPKFKKEGAGMLLIPSKLAYGSRGQGDIAPNTVLVFDIELIDFD